MTPCSTSMAPAVMTAWLTLKRVTNSIAETPKAAPESLRNSPPAM